MRLFVIALTAIAGLAPVAAGQAPQQPVFRASTSIVEVTVIVRDGDGRFVRDLTIDDFEVREKGVAQEIQTLYLVERPAQPAAVSTAPDAPEPAAAPPPARRTFVFLFDMDHLSPGGLTRAREAVETFAASRLLPSDVSGVAAIGAASGRISGDHGATVETASQLKPRADRVMREQTVRQWPRILSPMEALAIVANNEAELIRIRDRACEERGVDCSFVEGGGGETEGAGSGKAELAGMPMEANRETIEAELRQKATSYVGESRVAAARSVGALMQISAGLERIPGRKTIIWMTEGTWPEEIARTATDAAYRASQSGVVVYTLDPRGLSRSDMGALDTAAPADVGQAFLQDQDDIANAMAEGSGGRAIRNENNLGRALGMIEDDTSTYYVLGYAPADAGERTTYRPLQVRVMREGLDARVRHGFMAPQRLSERATEPEPAPEPATAPPAPVVPPVPPVPSVPVPAAPEPVEPDLEPVEPAEPATARIGRLYDTATADGRRLGAEGLQAYQRGDIETALPLLERAATDPGAPAWVHYALGFSYIGVNKPKQAIASWERVVEAAPEFAPAYFDLAMTYAQVKDFTGALSVLRTAARRWPADPEVHNAMGVTLTRRGDLDGAVDAFERAVKADARNPVSLLNLGRAYELRFIRDRRWVAAQNRWVGSTEDRAQAKAYYERCASFGGPYGEKAQEALERLAWSD